MDPQARHSTWSLLQKFKKEKDVTILLTTHFMDEVILIKTLYVIVFEDFYVQIFF